MTQEPESQIVQAKVGETRVEGHKATVTIRFDPARTWLFLGAVLVLGVVLIVLGRSVFQFADADLLVDVGTGLVAAEIFTALVLVIMPARIAPY